MNTDKIGIFWSDDKVSANIPSEPSTLSGREMEFQSALESYLYDYRLEMRTHKGRGANVPRDDRPRFAERLVYHLGRFLTLVAPSRRTQGNSQPRARQSW